MLYAIGLVIAFILSYKWTKEGYTVDDDTYTVMINTDDDDYDL